MFKIPKKHLNHLSLTLGLWLIGSLILTLYVLAIYFNWDFHHLKTNFLTLTNNRLLISSLIIGLIIMFCYAFTGEIVLAEVSTFVLLEILLTIDKIKRFNRDIPLIPEDLFLAKEAKNVAFLIDWFGVLLIVLKIILVVAISLLIVKKLKLPRLKLKDWRLLAFRGLLVIGSSLSLISLADYLANPQLIHSDQNIVRSKMVLWNQLINYQDNGPIIGLLYNFGTPPADKPADYSQANIIKIVNKYTQQAAQINAERQNLNDINVIFIMNESFTDPNDYTKYYPLDKNPLPFTRSLMANTTSGRITSSEFGGGTSNVEFEALTGLSNVFNNGNMPFNNHLSKTPNFPSLVQIFNNYNYQTIAIHPYKKEMYKRNLVYDNLGFDNFIDQDKMTYVDSIGQTCSIDKTSSRDCFISDQANYQEIIKLLNETKQPLFIHNVTMQNHASYQDKYELSGFTHQIGNDEAFNNRANYLEGLNHSDQAMKNLINQIKQLDKKVVVVFWGDHLPASNIFGKVLTDNYHLAHQTPFFIYTNFKTANTKVDNSANYIQNLVFDQLQVKYSPFMAFLDQLKQDLPVFDSTNIQQTTAQAKIKEYQLIQYDIMHGQKYLNQTDFFKIKK